MQRPTIAAAPAGERLYFNSLPSEYTRKAYKVYFDKYLQIIGYKDSNELLATAMENPKQIENEIIEFIISLKERGSKFPTISNYVKPIIGYCKINDILINVDKVNRFMPPYVRNRKTREYLVSEIQAMLDIADERMRCVILCLSSVGLRINGLCGLTVGNLKSVNNDTMYQITVYENQPEEYVTFCSTECKNLGIDPYLRMRERYSEVITPSSPLIREQFDRRDPFAAAHARPTKSTSLTRKLVEMAEAAGIRTKIQLESGQKGASYRQPVPVCNGFRRYFCKTLLDSGLQTEKRWLLEGHNLKGNDSSYLKITTDDLLQSYLLAHDNILVEQSQKLRQRIEKLEIEKTQIEVLTQELAEIKQHLDFKK